MAGLTRAAREAQAFAAVRARFLDRLGEDADPEKVVLADKAARLVVKVAALDAAAEKRDLTDTEAASLLQGSRMLGEVTRLLGIARAPSRGRSA